MTIDILICTIDEGIGSVGDVLMPPMPGVHYVVSVQYTAPLPLAIADGGRESGAAAPAIPESIARRADVTVTTLAGRGLSRNRNNALRHATADIIVIADDDCRYTPASVDAIRSAYAAHPEADAICFRAAGYDGTPLKHYPEADATYADACRSGYYAASVEMTFRRSRLVERGIWFNELYGLGAKYPASEEEVLLCDAAAAGLTLRYAATEIVRTDPVTTGADFLVSVPLQVTKGAAFRYRYGVAGALWRTLKEGGYHLIRHGVNPLPIWSNMLRGILGR